MTLQAYVEKFARINVNQTRGRASPHKICMLMAVLDLARAGALQRNEIYYGPALLDRYRQYFNAVRTDRDHPNPWFPFFHLRGALRGRGATFWHLNPLPGREAALSVIKTAASSRVITDNIDFASLDPELHALLQSPGNIDILAAALAEQWFDRGLHELRQIAAREQRISEYEHALRDLPSAARSVREVPRAVRDPAFRRVVTDIYDYRCAATGTRLLLADGTAMVAAAHIQDHALTGDDDPRNGLALTPDMHWAMDKGLIAPTPDYTWRVSAVLDERIPDNRFLCRLQGQQLILPREKRWYPRQDVLEWRLAQLL